MEEVGVVLERRLTNEDVLEQLLRAGLKVQKSQVERSELVVSQPTRDELDVRVAVFTTSSDTESLEQVVGSKEIVNLIPVRTVVSISFSEIGPGLDEVVDAVVAAVSPSERGFVECSGAYWAVKDALDSRSRFGVSIWRRQLDKVGHEALQRALSMLKGSKL